MTTYATDANEVMVGLEFEYGTHRGGYAGLNQWDDLERSARVINATGMWNVVSEHTGREANLARPMSLAAAREAMEVLHSTFDELEREDGIRCVVDHTDLCGFHVHVNVEKDVGPAVYLPSFWNTYIEDGYQERMWSLITRKVRRGYQYGNHTARAHLLFHEAIEQANIAYLHQHHTDEGIRYLLSWQGGRGYDFSPRTNLGSVELRTWNAVNKRATTERRFQFLRGMLNRVIQRTPSGVQPTRYLTGGVEIAQSEWVRIRNTARY